MTPGRQGGIALLDNYTMSKALLNDDEKSDLLTALTALNQTPFKVNESALHKLASLFGHQNTDWIEISFSSWNDSAEEESIFKLLKTAIINQKIITFLYASAQGENLRRSVEPLKLFFKGGFWYLYGFCRFRQDFRFFKLKRLKDLKLSNENFQRIIPVNLNMQEKSSSPQIKLILRLEQTLAYRVYDEFTEIEKQPDGYFHVTLMMPDNNWLYSYLLSFGAECEVLAPAKVRQRLQQIIRQLSEKYQ
ncbi:hypothetical protein SDC9_118392 [bioreactor metagenome]|uniref:Uncharacterized protein n=1 Tax=bioreactor metagenome TaxID=1076179 RepID=A0A645C2I0_9ZZZZ